MLAVILAVILSNPEQQIPRLDGYLKLISALSSGNNGNICYNVNNYLLDP